SFLIGQPQLRDMMRSPQMQQLRQRVIASYHLGPLDKAEARAYIEHRLKCVGWKGDPQIEPDCFDLIHTVTGGIPRRINTLCNRLLLAAYLSEKHTIGSNDVHSIAREIHEELGPDAVLAPIAATHAAEGLMTARMSGVRLDKHFDHLEERIDRLEKTVSAAVDLLHRLLHPDRATKPGAPGGR
ncbi:MAG: ATPase, partial [Gemmatimonas sp.]